ncbi:MAG: hypothetical protein EA362_07025 [Saprospirales bacterium]|nr:MAG: hypothetical protein EA362_07025 [Saprospirales bacterium]
MRYLFSILFVGGFLIFDAHWTQLDAQVDSTDIERLQDYNWRIMQRKLNNVYIPSDIHDAMIELGEISSESAMNSFRTAPEEDIGRRLFFGLGKWITTNWQFYEGSRFSHYLRNLGLTHPDDMTIFVIESFHRHLNGKDLEVEQRVEKLKDARRLWVRDIYQVDTLQIDTLRPDKN